MGWDLVSSDWWGFGGIGVWVKVFSFCAFDSRAHALRFLEFDFLVQQRRTFHRASRNARLLGARYHSTDKVIVHREAVAVNVKETGFL